MWIRSQDKKELYNLNALINIYIRKLYRNNTEWIIYADGEFDLGVYASEENANKVLDYIQECICSGKKEMNMPIEVDGELIK